MRKKQGVSGFGKTRGGNRSKNEAVRRMHREAMKGKKTHGAKAHHGVMSGDIGGAGHFGWQNGDGSGFEIG